MNELVTDTDTIIKSIQTAINEVVSCIRESKKSMLEKFIKNEHINYEFDKLNIFDELDCMFVNTMHEYVEVNSEITQVITGSDIHGDIVAFISILQYYIETLKYNSKCALVITGDYLDRGNANMLVLALLVKIARRRLNNVFFLRGNHENDDYIDNEFDTIIDEDDNFVEIHPLLKGYFRTLPYIVFITIEDKRLAFTHAALPLEKVQTTLYKKAIDYKYENYLKEHLEDSLISSENFHNIECKTDIKKRYQITWSDIVLKYKNHAIVYESRTPLSLEHVLGSMLINDIDVLVRGHQASMLRKNYRASILDIENSLQEINKHIISTEYKKSFSSATENIDEIMSKINNANDCVSNIKIATQELNSYDESLKTVEKNKQEFEASIENEFKDIEIDEDLSNELEATRRTYDTEIESVKSKINETNSKLDINKQNLSIILDFSLDDYSEELVNTKLNELNDKLDNLKLTNSSRSSSSSFSRNSSSSFSRSSSKPYKVVTYKDAMRYIRDDMKNDSHFDAKGNLIMFNKKDVRDITSNTAQQFKEMLNIDIESETDITPKRFYFTDTHHTVITSHLTNLVAGAFLNMTSKACDVISIDNPSQSSLLFDNLKQ